MSEYLLLLIFLGAIGTGLYFLIKYINRPTTEPISEKRGQDVKNWFKKTF
jgi:hypothetical protein